MPYWRNGAAVSDGRVKVSYYRYEAVDGAVSLLAFIANTSKEEVGGVTLRLNEAAPLTRWTDLTAGRDDPGAFSLKPYEFRILYIR